MNDNRQVAAEKDKAYNEGYRNGRLDKLLQIPPLQCALTSKRPGYAEGYSNGYHNTHDAL